MAVTDIGTNWIRFCSSMLEIDTRVLRTCDRRIRLLLMQHLVSPLVDKETFTRAYMFSKLGDCTREQCAIASVVFKIKKFAQDAGLEENLSIEQYANSIDATWNADKKSIRFISAARHGLTPIILHAFEETQPSSCFEKVRTTMSRIFGYPVGNEWITEEVLNKALSEAVKGGNISTVRALLQNPLFTERITHFCPVLVFAIHSAIEMGQATILQLLLAFHYILENPEKVLAYGDYDSLLMKAIGAGYVSTLDVILSNKALFSIDERKLRLIVEKASRSNPILVQRFIRKGFFSEKQIKKWFHSAIALGKSHVFKALLDNWIISPWELTCALHEILDGRQIKFFQVFVASKRLLDIPLEELYWAFEKMACSGNHVAFLEIALQSSWWPTVQDKYTPVMRAFLFYQATYNNNEKLLQAVCYEASPEMLNRMYKYLELFINNEAEGEDVFAHPERFPHIHSGKRTKALMFACLEYLKEQFQSHSEIRYQMFDLLPITCKKWIFATICEIEREKGRVVDGKEAFFEPFHRFVTDEIRAFAIQQILDVNKNILL